MTTTIHNPFLAALVAVSTFLAAIASAAPVDDLKAGDDIYFRFLSTRFVLVNSTGTHQGALPISGDIQSFRLPGQLNCSLPLQKLIDIQPGADIKLASSLPVAGELDYTLTCPALVGSDVQIQGVGGTTELVHITNITGSMSFNVSTLPEPIVYPGNSRFYSTIMREIPAKPNVVTITGTESNKPWKLTLTSQIFGTGGFHYGTGSSPDGVIVGGKVVSNWVSFAGPPATVGSAGNIKLRLFSPAGAAGAIITLKTDATKVTVPASVKIPANASSITVPLKYLGTPPTAATASHISASYNGLTTSNFISLRPMFAWLRFPPQAVGGQQILLDVYAGSHSSLQVSPSAIEQVVVHLSCSDPNILLPSTVTIPAGKGFVELKIQTSVVTAPETATIVADVNGVTFGGYLTPVFTLKLTP